ncbi:dioxygenase family protein [Rhizobium ruizarguesonis]|uniref:dioxygenase family protein n=1 Tax=Rhizobium ruizarguesonis TaxID=2081791 RepID=UPI001030F1AE|nr:6-chlorohydroxyquinol-1,2-dioxygenase [Rhizobium ruizarguesonis]TAZ92468.1 6-chlorohydroxyquinol-1,2-dioxygenase [Rhizobium ruizarguesonis]TBA14264.1 6-chlorohydroxyquinol-1,2-dioxygenase [Rhizobium ruizarguesonis]TBA35704.1 6-chlorohydroxyquinol-1,2-dioxygenase [Rhizobium ruizarguesonis]TBA55087.1 6-chlorohydroxyquinol-1,2-dioxygenase [Rhizobium ruizarguesonis]
MMTGSARALTFDEATSSEAFAERFSANRNGKLAHLIAAAVTHVHDLIKEFRPSPDEWRKVIQFLTEVGHASDERRREWVLLSDLIGASALVEEINSRRQKGATPNTIRGPFYRDDAPERSSGASISVDGKGEPLRVSVRVQDLDGLPIGGAEVVTWQANAEGFYENQQPDLQPEHNLRGLFRTDTKGCVMYRSVMPAGYGVPDDGPVGRLLKGAGYPLHRPAHLQFVVRAKGFETITTHIYDSSDPRLAEDALFGVRPDLVARFEHAQVDGRRGRSVDLTFVMVRARPGRQG